MRKVALVGAVILGSLLPTVSPALGIALPKGAVPVTANQVKFSGSLQCAKLAGKWVSGRTIRRGKNTYFLSDQRQIANLLAKPPLNESEKLTIADLRSKRQTNSQLCSRLGYVAINRTDFMAVGFGKPNTNVKKASAPGSPATRKIYSVSPSGLFGITSNGTTVDAFTSYVGARLSGTLEFIPKTSRPPVVERIYDKPSQVTLIHYYSHPEDCLISAIYYGRVGTEQCLIRKTEFEELGLIGIGNSIFYSSDSDPLIVNIEGNRVVVKVQIGRSDGRSCERPFLEGLLLISFSPNLLPTSQLLVGGCGRSITQFELVGNQVAYIHSGLSLKRSLSTVELRGAALPPLELPDSLGVSRMHVIPTECGNHYEVFFTGGFSLSDFTANLVRATYSPGASSWTFEPYLGRSTGTSPPLSVNKLANPYNFPSCSKYYDELANRNRYAYDDITPGKYGGDFRTMFRSTRPDGVCYKRWDPEIKLRQYERDDGSTYWTPSPGWISFCPWLRTALYGIAQYGGEIDSKPTLMRLFPQLDVIGDLSTVGIAMPYMAQAFGESFVFASPNGMECVVAATPRSENMPSNYCASPSLTILTLRNHKIPMKATILDLASNQLAVTRLLQPEYREGSPYALLIEAIRLTDGQLFFGILDASGRLSWTDTGLMHPLKGRR